MQQHELYGKCHHKSKCTVGIWIITITLFKRSKNCVVCVISDIVPQRMNNWNKSKIPQKDSYENWTKNISIETKTEMKKEEKKNLKNIFTVCIHSLICVVCTNAYQSYTPAVRWAHGTREKPNLSTRLLNKGSKHKANHIQLHVILIIYGQASSWIKRNEEDAQPKCLCSFKRVPIFKLSIAKR